MQHQRPIKARSFMNGTTVIGIPCHGLCIIITIVLFFILLIVGIVLAIISPNREVCYSISMGVICYRYLTKARIAGITLSVIGGVILFVSAILACKAHRDNKVVVGTVLTQQTVPNQQGSAVPVQTHYPPNYQTPPMGYPLAQPQPLSQNAPMVYPQPEAQPLLHNPPIVPPSQNPPMVYTQAHNSPVVPQAPNPPTVYPQAQPQHLLQNAPMVYPQPEAQPLLYNPPVGPQAPPPNAPMVYPQAPPQPAFENQPEHLEKPPPYQ